VVQKPFGIILFVGEGLSADRLAALRMYAANAETPLTLDTLSYTALLRNYSTDSATPDSAAAATALATGVKVNNGAIGVDAEGNTLTNLLELARASGRTTGLVTDGRLTNASAAAFYAHTGAPDDVQELARTLVDTAKIDIVLGGGSLDFVPEYEGGTRSDGRDLLTEADDAGYDLVRTRTELEDVAWWRWPKVFGVFGPAELTYGGEIGPDTPQPSLSDMVRRAVELLQIHRGGYLLVVDAALMRRGAEQNDVEAMLRAMTEFDRAVSVALRFAGNKTTVFVCGDAAIGGFKISGSLLRGAGGAELLAKDSLGGARLTWATGPSGAPAEQAPSTAPAAETAPAATPDTPDQASSASTPPTVLAGPIAPPEMQSDSESHEAPPVDETGAASTAPPPSTVTAAASASPTATAAALHAPAAVYAPAALNTVEDVIAFGHGRGAEALHGVLENTALFEIIRDNL
jgi:alkaline phosphatase